jgi:hypothetical protein
MIKRIVIQLVCWAIFFTGCNRDDEQSLIFTPIDLDQFGENLKGFNLLGKFDVEWSICHVEPDRQYGNYQQ